MSEYKVRKCDACGLERADGNHAWYDNFNGGSMNITPDGCNGKIEFDNLCPKCRSRLFNAFHDEFRMIRLNNSNMSKVSQ